MALDSINFLAIVSLVITFMYVDLCTSVPTSELSIIMNFRFNVCRAGNDDVLLNQISYAQCISNCDVRATCNSINYDRLHSLCRLHTGVTNEVPCDFTGTVYFQKKPNSIPIQNDCSHCMYQDGCLLDTTTNTTECVHKECASLVSYGGAPLLQEGNLLTVGSRVKVTCQQGSSLIGPSLRECYPDGQWSDYPALCYPDTTTTSSTTLVTSTLVTTLSVTTPMVTTPLVTTPIVTTALTTTALMSFCPPGWYERDGSCYLFLLGTTEKRTFANALDHCQGLNDVSYLLTIGGSSEFDYIVEQLDALITSSRWNRVVWLGITEDANGDWLNVMDGSDVPFYNWGSNEPNDFQGTLEECGALKNMKAEGGWKFNDKDCFSTSEVVCEMRP